jgi:Na+/H+-dicarboxylate symporter
MLENPCKMVSSANPGRGGFSRSAFPLRGRRNERRRQGAAGRKMATQHSIAQGAPPLTRQILIGMAAGLIVGAALNQYFAADESLRAGAADLLQLLSDMFLRLIKMVIAPLIFATLVTGVAGMGDSAALGRIATRAIGWFVMASLISIGVGLVLINLFQTGASLHYSPAGALQGVSTTSFTFRHFVEEIFPESVFAAMAKNSVLQILVFSLFVGVAASALGERAAPLVQACEALAQTMLQITSYVMRFSPFAVFGALASVITLKGLHIVIVYGLLIGEFYFGLLLLWAILLSVATLSLGRRTLPLLRYIREPVLLAFSTATSESALPRLLERLDRFGVPRRISGFVVPLGYSFNLDGSMMYASFATVFIAQAYGVQLSALQQIVMLLTLMVSSKGIAGVPRASLVVIAATLTQFGLPAEGVGLLLGIDTFLDMGRTATNVLGNAVATAVITRWEGMLQPMRDAEDDLAPTPSDTPEHGKRGLNIDPEQ